jgi:hypothetical protein
MHATIASFDLMAVLRPFVILLPMCIRCIQRWQEATPVALSQHGKVCWPRAWVKTVFGLKGSIPEVELTNLLCSEDVLDALADAGDDLAGSFHRADRDMRSGRDAAFADVSRRVDRMQGRQVYRSFSGAYCEAARAFAHSFADVACAAGHLAAGASAVFLVVSRLRVLTRSALIGLAGRSLAPGRRHSEYSQSNTRQNSKLRSHGVAPPGHLASILA